MKIIITILIIITIIIIFTVLKKKYENFRNFEYQNYDKKKLMTPIATNMSSLNLGKTSSLQVLSPSELKKKLKIFTIVKEQYKYKELCGLKYNYYKIKGNKINPFIKIVKIFLKMFKKQIEIIVSTKKICQGINPCIVNILKYSIIKLDTFEDFKRITGQFLFDFNNRPFRYLIGFVISTEGNLSIHKLNFLAMDIPGNTRKLNDNNDIYPKNIEIYSRPLISKYNASKTYLYNSTEVLDKKKEEKIDKKIFLTKKEPIDLLAPRCYGRDADNKIDCEKEYEKIDGKLKKLDIVGIWDKPCITNEECPFYQKNKNYPNNYGKCLGNGYCEIPVGINQLSPHFFKNKERGICYNCKKGINCCKEQENDRTKYPNLNSPDYFFKGNKRDRVKYYNLLTKKNLEVYNVLDYNNL